MATGFRKASALERFRIGKLLEEHLVRVSGTEEEPGTCYYSDPEWSDMRVAERAQTGPGPLPVNSVTRIRTELFGKLVPVPAPDPNEQLIQSINDALDRLVDRVARLEATVSRLESRDA